MQLSKLLCALIFTGGFVSAHAITTNSGEGYDQSAFTVSGVNVEGCLPEIDVLSRQIKNSSIDIAGPLPFSRVYGTNLQLDFKPEFRNAEGKSLDGAFATSYMEGRSLMGVGWTHNYDYELQTFGNTQINTYYLYMLKTPGGHYPITIMKQSNGTYKVVSTVNDTNPAPDTEYKVTDNNLTIIIKINGMELTFQSLSGARGIIQKFQLTKIKNQGGKEVTLTYSTSVRNGVTAYLLTGVSDNFGNSLKINRINMNGSDTSTIATQLRGFISSVETNSNPLNKQTVNYSYETFNYINRGSTQLQAILTQAVSNANGTQAYGYNKSYVHKGMYTDSAQTIRGVTIPILKSYTNNGSVVRNWEANDNSIATYTNKNNDYGVLKFTEDTQQFLSGNPYYQSATLTLTPPSSITAPLANEVFVVENGNGPDGPSIAYLSNSSMACLMSNGKPTKSLIFKKDIRQLIKVTDKNNNLTEIGYEGSNRVNKVTLAKGSAVEQVQSATYTTDFNIPSTATKGNLTTTNTINTLGQVTKSVQTSTQTGSIAKATDFVAQSNGLLISVDGPRTGTTDKVTYTYDSYGNKATESQVVNGVTRTTSYIGYNSFGQPERVVYPSGLVDKFVYNADGTIASKTTGVGTATSTITGKTTTYAYDSLKRLIAETNPDSETTSYAYDAAGRVIKTTLPDGSLVNKTYYGNSIVATENLTDSTGGTVLTQSSTSLDSNGRPLTVQAGTNSSKNAVTNTYDLNGNITQTSSSLGITEKWTHDALNRVKTHTDGLGNVDTKTYDVQDNTITSIDALNAGTNPYSYRNGKVLTKEVNTDYGTKNYIYNEADLLTQSLYSDRKCDNLNIDALERVGQTACVSASTTTPALMLSNLTYSFDQTRFGRLDKVTSTDTLHGVDTIYTYDAYDRIVGKTQTNKSITAWAGTQPTLAVAYGYTAGDKMSGLKLPSGRQLAFTYDTVKKNQLTNITLDGNALIRAISYDAGGRLTGWNWGAGAANYKWTYDDVKNGVIKSITNKNNSGAVNYSLSYDFDNDGRINKITRNNGLIDSYTYSNADRLLTETRVNGATSVYGITYTYDKNGNRLSLVATGSHQQPQANVVYTYTGNKLATIRSTAVTHTANAELIYGGFTPTYDNAGNRRSDKTTGGADTAPQYYMTYTHKNERAIRAYANNTAWKANAIQYIYDESSHLLGEYNSDGVPLVEYIWMGDKPVAAIYGSGSTAKTYWIITDSQNTPRRLIDSTDGAATVWAWDSTSFGVGNPSIETVKFNLRFPGQYYDELTKQHYNHTRYYSPEIGRYMEPDRIGLEGGLNPYIYANGNPVSNIDVDGMDYLDIFGNNARVDTENYLPSFLYDLTYSLNDGLSLGLWSTFNNWYYGGATGFNPYSFGGVVGTGLSMAYTGPASFVRRNTGVVVGEVGSYAALAKKQVSFDGIELHHMPQDGLHFLSRGEGGAIALTKKEHELTRTYGSKGRATKIEDAQLTFRQALYKDIKDIRSFSGPTYNQNLIDLLNYYRNHHPQLMIKDVKGK